MSSVRKSRRWATVVALIVLPLAVAGMLFGTVSGRAEASGRIRAAVVNLDQMVYMGDTNGNGKQDEGEDNFQPMLGGRLVAAALTAPAADSPTNLEWTLTDRSDAADGLASGTYSVVATIPKDFSAALVTISSDAPRQATVRVEVNSTTSATTGELGRQDVQAAVGSVGSMLTNQVVAGLYGGFSTTGEQLGTAADGAEQLADGVDQLASGTDASAKGAKDLAKGLDQLADGTGLLASQTPALVSGTGQLADGAEQLASGTSQLAGGAQGLASGTAQLDTGLQGLATGTTKLSDGAGKLSTGADQLSTGVKGLADGAGKLSTGADQLSTGADQLSTGVKGLADGAGQLSTGADQLSTGADQLSTGTVKLAKGLKTLDDQVADMPDQVKALATGTQGVVTYVDQIGPEASSALENIQTAGAALAGAADVGTDLTDMKTQLEAAGKTTGSVGELAQSLSDLATQCAGVSSDPALCQSLGQAAQTALGLAQKLGAELGAVGADATKVGATAEGLAAAGPALEKAGTSAGTISAMVNGPLPDGTPTLAEVATTLNEGTQKFAESAPDLAAGVHELATGAKKLATGAQGVATGAQGVASGVSGLSDGAGKLSTGASTLATGAQGVASGVSGLSDGAGKLSTGASTLAGGVSGLASGVSELSTGTSKIAAGSGALDSGAQALAQGTGALVTGANGLATGTRQLADQSGALASGTSQLATGAKGAAEGTGKLADGLGKLASGADGAASGAKDLAGGLGTAVEKIPSYTDAQVQQIAQVVTTPVATQDTSAEQADQATVGAPWILPIALWLGALAAFILFTAVPAGSRFATVGPTRLTLAAWLPGIALTAIGTVALMIVLPIAGVHFANWIGAFCVALLAAVSFTLVNQALRALWGRIGIVVSLVLFALQVACLGGAIPVDSLPAFFRTAASVLPMPMAAGALTPMIPGTSGSLAAGILGLLLWAAGSFALTTWVIRRSQAGSTVPAAATA